MVKRVVCFAYKDLSSTSVRYRIKYPFDFLQTHRSIRVRTATMNSSWRVVLLILECLMFFRTATTVMVIHGVSGSDGLSKWIQVMLRFRNFRMIYDLDEGNYLKGDVDSFSYFVNRAHSITLGHESLAEVVKSNNKRTQVIPSPIPDLGHSADIHFDECVVGWIGDYDVEDAADESFSNKRALYDLVFPAFLDISFPVKLVLLGINSNEDARDIKLYFQDCPFVKLDIPIAFDRTNEEAVQRQICSWDIGLAPLIDHEFNRTTSAIALKQYINNGVPILASSVGNQSSLFGEHEGGFTCGNSEDFLNGMIAISLLSKKERLAWRDALLTRRHAFSVTHASELWLKEFS